MLVGMLLSRNKRLNEKRKAPKGKVVYAVIHVIYDTIRVILSLDHYDPDRHCGVWLVDEKRNCLRSLTCKVCAVVLVGIAPDMSHLQYHSLSLRRQVKDRSKPFDELLMLHKEQKRGKSLSQGVVNSQPAIQGAQP